MRVLVIGAGAIGSVLGGFLADSGHEVTLLGRAWHMEAIRRWGLRISGIWGERHPHHLSTATRVDELPRAKPFDWILVCVKAYQTAEVARLLQPFLRERTLVCACQNGLGNYETLIQSASPDRVALARVIFGAELAPGHVRVSVCADSLLIGSPEARFPRARLAELAEALQKSGIPARPTEAILSALWMKVLYNCALNGLSALLEVPYGRLPEQPLCRRLMEAVIREAYRVAAAHRVALEPPSAEAYLELLFGRLIPDTAAHHSSMLQDLRRGKPTEIEALNGAIVRLGEELKVAAPMNALIRRLIRAKERFVGVSVLPE